MKTLTPERQVNESGYRFLNPQLGRWCSRDPIGERAGLHLYALLLNDPIASTDARGLQRYPPHPRIKCEFQLAVILQGLGEAVEDLMEPGEDGRACLEDFRCECCPKKTQRGSYDIASRTLRICWNNFDEIDDLTGLIHHELQHAKSLCGGPPRDCPDNFMEPGQRLNKACCFSKMKEEMKAERCGGTAACLGSWGRCYEDTLRDPWVLQGCDAYFGDPFTADRSKTELGTQQNKDDWADDSSCAGGGYGSPPPSLFPWQ